MKYASSIRFGGQLIDAKDCDYEDYKRLGLLCPECKDPVFLKAEGTRQQGGKEVKIGAHFSHFATKNPELAKVCENRVKGYTQADIDRAAAKAKGQRLKLLQRWFWNIISDNPQFQEGIEIGKQLGWDAEDNSPIALEMKQIGEELLAEDVESMRRNLLKSGVTETIDSMVSAMAEWAKRVSMGEEHWIWMQTQGKLHFVLLSEIDISLHKRICFEVVEFLASKRQRHLFEQLIESVNGLAERVYELSSHWDEAILIDCNPGDKIDLYLFLEIICAIPWADEFARLSAESKVGAA